ncbi:MAG: hypothetical protein U1A78_07880 [Polyangia bacterium]
MSNTSYVQALIRAIEKGPRRAGLEKHLSFYLDMDAPPHLVALLKAWAWHTVSGLRIGPFTMSDRAIRASFELPVWVKDGSGPHAEAYIDDSQVRSDVIVLGTWLRDKNTETLGIVRDRRTIQDRVVSIRGPYTTTHGTLDDVLRSCHAAGASDLVLEPAAEAPR